MEDMHCVIIPRVFDTTITTISKFHQRSSTGLRFFFQHPHASTLSDIYLHPLKHRLHIRSHKCTFWHFTQEPLLLLNIQSIRRQSIYRPRDVATSCQLDKQLIRALGAYKQVVDLIPSSSAILATLLPSLKMLNARHCRGGMGMGGAPYTSSNAPGDDEPGTPLLFACGIPVKPQYRSRLSWMPFAVALRLSSLNTSTLLTTSFAASRISYDPIASVSLE